MSDPKTQAERDQAERTRACAGAADNLVSTACPDCGTRFAMLARYTVAGWHLTCIVCGCRQTGVLKTEAEGLWRLT